MNSTRAQSRGLGLKGRLLLAVTVAAISVALIGAVAYASDTPPGSSIIEVQTAPPQEGADELEGDSELPWLFAVFIITWAAFFGYVFFMSRRQREMRREIETLRLALLEQERAKPMAGLGFEAQGP